MRSSHCPFGIMGFKPRSRPGEYRWLSRNPSAASTVPTMITAVRFTPAASTCPAMSPSVPRSTTSRCWLAYATTAAGQPGP